MPPGARDGSELSLKPIPSLVPSFRRAVYRAPHRPPPYYANRAISSKDQWESATRRWPPVKLRHSQRRQPAASAIMPQPPASAFPERLQSPDGLITGGVLPGASSTGWRPAESCSPPELFLIAARDGGFG
jgi:hypothetical protein